MNKTKHNWAELGRRLGISNMEPWVTQNIIARLHMLDNSGTNERGRRKDLDRPFSVAFMLFCISFMALHFILPESWPFIVLRFIAFPILFLGAIALVVFIFRDRLSALIEQSRQAFIIRSDVLGQIASRLALEYCAVPGGASKGLKMLARWKYAPRAAKVAVAEMTQHSGMIKQSRIIQRSGIISPSEFMLGSQQSKETYIRDWHRNLQFEDGLMGERNGMPFFVAQWDDKSDDSTVHHTLLAVTLPREIHSRIEFKSKRASWPKLHKASHFKSVQLLSGAFRTKWKVRATDQSESRYIFDPLVIERLTALSHDDPVKGVVFEDYLVIDIVGDNRLDIVNLLTGEWSEDTVAQTFVDLADILDFVTAVGHAFSSPARRIAS